MTEEEATAFFWETWHNTAYPDHPRLVATPSDGALHKFDSSRAVQGEDGRKRVIDMVGRLRSFPPLWARTALRTDPSNCVMFGDWTPQLSFSHDGDELILTMTIEGAGFQKNPDN